MNSIPSALFQKLRSALVGGLTLIALGAAVAQPAGSAYIFTHLAGPLGGPGTADGTGTAARFNTPDGVAADSAGNLYVVDSQNNTIRKITPAGVVTTLAGKAGTKGSTDGAGAAARFSDAHGIAVDSTGNVYVADSGNSTIRKITPAGVVTTLAGTAGAQGSSDGLGAAGWFWYPRAVAVDGTGTVYVADNSTIRKVTPAGLVSTLAGKAGPWGNADGTGPDAQFNAPAGIAVDNAGTVYVADTGNGRIRKITPAGVVTTLLGTYGYAEWFNNPLGIVVDSTGNLLIVEQYSNVISKLTPSGLKTTLAGYNYYYSGNTDGTGTDARFYNPRGMAMDGAGNLYVADSANHTIRKVTPATVVTTFAGLPGGYGSTDATGADARFAQPGGVAVDGAGNVYTADTNNSTIRKITPDGVVTTPAGWPQSLVYTTYPYYLYYPYYPYGYGGLDGNGAAARFYQPNGVAADNAGNLYVADTYDNAIRQVTPSAVVTTLAGSLGYYYSGSADGNGAAARFRYPEGVALDGAGNVYVTDTGNNTIRKITPAGVVTTLAGNAGVASSADGTGSAAQFSRPSGIAVTSAGTVYVADSGNCTIRKITPAGVVTTLAGWPGVAGFADGTGSAARFNNPLDLAVDTTGNLYVADSFNNTIRLITPGGVVTTIGGTASIVGCEDGIGAAARFNNPTGVAVDTTGNLYVTDSNNNSIRKAQLARIPAITTQPVSQNVTPGSNVEFSVSATSLLPLTYQWYVNGGLFSGATTNTLSLTNARTTDSGNYTVIITNALGSVTSNIAALTVAAATPTTPSAAQDSGGGGGGGSIESWFVLAMLVLGAARRLAGRQCSQEKAS